MKINPSQAEFGTIIKQSFGKISGDESLEMKKHRLRKATKEFESYFVLHMLKAMRKTIPESELTSGGLGQGIYTEMFDEQLARKVSGTSANSLADMLYKSLVTQLEAGENSDNAIDDKINTGISDLPRNVNTSEKNANSLKAGESQIEKSEHSISPPIVLKPQISNDPRLSKFGQSIKAASQKYALSPQLIYSVILAESGGQADAVSHKGAKGLMQLTDTTAVEMGVSDSLDPAQNIMGGAKYLRIMLDNFEGNLKLALAAYNAGPGIVSKYNGVPPYPETEKYIEKVLDILQSNKRG
ncbi:MAG: transglycosylase SLT domain-containing protein [Candidatus Zixiibacteriota bacterium]